MVELGESQTNGEHRFSASRPASSHDSSHIGNGSAVDHQPISHGDRQKRST
jgi:hypothetical protein